jgi:hypothetical protein
MRNYRLVQNKTRAKKKRVISVILATFLTILVLAGAFYLWINTGEKKLIWASAYRVHVPGDPGASGKLYSLRNGEYLLVLTSPSSKRPEGYHINLDTHEIGLPSFSKSSYIPLVRSALVDDETLEGYPFYGTIEANWEVGSDGQEVRIHIKGYADVALQVDPSCDLHELARETIPIGHQKEIVLAK